MKEDDATIRDDADVAPSKDASALTRSALTEERLRSYGVVPVVELDDPEQADALFAALSEGGIAAAEITLRTSGAATALAKLIDRNPKALLGAGTVRSLDDARRVVDMGATFVASPGTDESVVTYCLENDVLVLPGVCTPTEILRALGAGARVLKFFPAEAIGGVGYLKALAGPFRDVGFVATGGINPTNLESYLRLPQVASCGGSWMVAPELLAAGRFDEITRLTRQAVDIVEAVRGDH